MDATPAQTDPRAEQRRLERILSEHLERARRTEPVRTELDDEDKALSEFIDRVVLKKKDDKKRAPAPLSPRSRGPPLILLAEQQERWYRDPTSPNHAMAVECRRRRGGSHTVYSPNAPDASGIITYSINTIQY